MHNYSAKGTICGFNSYQTACIRVSMSIQLNGINCFYGAHQA
ncbi:arginine ABC transporter ATP-binding protein ArtP, partial [Salmonella enterica subsp. enterica serovar Newport]